MGPNAIVVSMTVFIVLAMIAAHLQIKPSDCSLPVLVYVRRAQFWDKLGIYQNAVDDLSNAICLDSYNASYCLNSENASYHNQRAEVYEKVGKDDLAWTDRQIAERILLGPGPCARPILIF
jgi:hypothetical protein